MAVSKDEKGNPAYLRMQLTPNVQSTSIAELARNRIAYASKVQTDGFNAYRKPLAARYDHEWEVFNPDGELLKWLHYMIGNTKTFINGTYTEPEPSTCKCISASSATVSIGENFIVLSLMGFGLLLLANTIFCAVLIKRDNQKIFILASISTSPIGVEAIFKTHWTN